MILKYIMLYYIIYIYNHIHYALSSYIIHCIYPCSRGASQLFPSQLVLEWSDDIITWTERMTTMPDTSQAAGLFVHPGIPTIG